MRQDFNLIIQRAKIDPITAIAVFDNGSFRQVLKPTFGKEIISNHGSIENYLEKLKQDGITNITVQEYRKNGSSIKKVGAPVTVTFGNEKQVATGMTNFNSLQGIGLGFAEIMNLNTDSVLKTKYETELEFTKRELEETKKQRDELKEEILKMRYDADKGSKQSELITGLASVFAPMLQGMMTGGQGSLNAPATDVNISQLKNNLINIVQNQSFSDDFATVLLTVIEKINTQQNFYEDLLKLMETNNQTE